jgi:hypothetical protein
VRRAALTAVLALTAGALAACGGSATPANLVSVSNGGCGAGWHPAGPGWHTFLIYNGAAEGGEVDLIDPANGAIYAEVNGLGPGTTSPMSLDVGSGSYAFRCLFDDYDPLDEQTFLVNTINQIEESKYWASTAIVITYDDSDGWYDHQASPIVNGSDTAADEAICTSVAAKLGDTPDRCGFGPRLPLVVISPYTRDNYVSNNLTDQASVTKFIEDNWLGGRQIPNGSYDAISGRLDAPGGVLDFHTRPHFRPLILNPTTGEVVSG